MNNTATKAVYSFCDKVFPDSVILSLLSYFNEGLFLLYFGM